MGHVEQELYNDGKVKIEWNADQRIHFHNGSSIRVDCSGEEMRSICDVLKLAKEKLT